jgi:membrane protein YqaA with SNARE-associated domain
MLFWTAHKGSAGFMAKAEPEGRAARFREWFRRYGTVTVFVPALVPIPMPLKVFVISAGVMGTSLAEFTGVVLVARILRYFGEAWLGVRLGLESTAFLKSHIWHFVGGAVALSLLLYVFIRRRDRLRGA